MATKDGQLARRTTCQNLPVAWLYRIAALPAIDFHARPDRRPAGRRHPIRDADGRQLARLRAVSDGNMSEALAKGQNGQKCYKIISQSINYKESIYCRFATVDSRCKIEF